MKFETIGALCYRLYENLAIWSLAGWIVIAYRRFSNGYCAWWWCRGKTVLFFKTTMVISTQ